MTTTDEASIPATFGDLRLTEGAAFVAIFADGTEVAGTLGEVQVDGDIDDAGHAYAYVEGATAKLADGREVWVNYAGEGQAAIGFAFETRAV